MPLFFQEHYNVIKFKTANVSVVEGGCDIKNGILCMLKDGRFLLVFFM